MISINIHSIVTRPDDIAVLWARCASGRLSPLNGTCRLYPLSSYKSYFLPSTKKTKLSCSSNSLRTNSVQSCFRYSIRPNPCKIRPPGVLPLAAILCHIMNHASSWTSDSDSCTTNNAALFIYRLCRIETKSFGCLPSLFL